MENTIKKEIIAYLCGNRDSPLIKNVVSLLELLTQEYRVDNDTALGDAVLRNQGSISALSRLKDYISKPMPNA